MAWPFRSAHPDLPGAHEIVTRVLITDENGDPVYMTRMKGGRAEVVINNERFRLDVQRVAVKRKPLAIEG